MCREHFQSVTVRILQGSRLDDTVSCAAATRDRIWNWDERTLACPGSRFVFFCWLGFRGGQWQRLSQKSSQIKELTRSYIIVLRIERRAKNGAVGKTRTKEVLTCGHFHVDIPMRTTVFRPPPAGATVRMSQFWPFSPCCLPTAWAWQ